MNSRMVNDMLFPWDLGISALFKVRCYESQVDYLESGNHFENLDLNVGMGKKDLVKEAYLGFWPKKKTKLHFYWDDKN